MTSQTRFTPKKRLKQIQLELSDKSDMNRTVSMSESTWCEEKIDTRTGLTVRSAKKLTKVETKLKRTLVKKKKFCLNAHT